MSRPQSEAVYHAVVLDDGAPVKKEAATQTTSSVVELDDGMFGHFKWSSTVLGFLIGFFIQFSTLGADFLLITLSGEKITARTKQDVIVFSLLWSFFTSAMAIVILAFLRNMISIAYRTAPNKPEEPLDEMIMQMECRFVVGALIGVCMLWTVTDMLLGMKLQIMYSLLTLVCAMVWCRVMLYCFSKPSEDPNEEDFEYHTEGLSEPLLVV